MYCVLFLYVLGHVLASIDDSIGMYCGMYHHCIGIYHHKIYQKQCDTSKIQTLIHTHTYHNTYQYTPSYLVCIE